jgi:hypothetical protein
MTFAVKTKKRDGKVYTVICDDLPHTLEIIEDQRARGFEVWVEDAASKRIDDTVFAPLAFAPRIKRARRAEARL